MGSQTVGAKKLGTQLIWALTYVFYGLMMAGVIGFMFAAGDIFGAYTAPISIWWPGTIIPSPVVFMLASAALVIVAALAAAGLSKLHEKITGYEVS